MEPLTAIANLLSAIINLVTAIVLYKLAKQNRGN